MARAPRQWRERRGAAPGGRNRARRDAGARHGGSCCWPRLRRECPVTKVASVQPHCGGRTGIDPGRLLEHDCTRSPDFALNLFRDAVRYGQTAVRSRLFQCDAVYHGTAIPPCALGILCRIRAVPDRLKGLPMARYRSRLPRVSPIAGRGRVQP